MDELLAHPRDDAFVHGEVVASAQGSTDPAHPIGYIVTRA
jgi:hypothetical protein